MTAPFRSGSTGPAARTDRLDAAHWLAARNTWWTGRAPAVLPAPDRATQEVLALLAGSDPPWLTVVDGVRQTGKSQLLAQLAAAHLAAGHAPQRLCHVALEHGPLRWQPAGALVEAWQRREGAQGARQTLLVDDFHLWSAVEQDSLAQLALDPDRRVVVAGMALESCVQRWRAAGLRVARCPLLPWHLGACAAHALPALNLPPAPRSLRELFEWPAERFAALVPAVQALQPTFTRHLQHGGFPAAFLAADAATAHRHLREEVVMRSLRWDAVGQHGVRRVDQLERTLLLIAQGCGQPLDVPALCLQLDVERPTVRHFLDLLEQAGLLRRMPPLGYGRQVQRARPLLALGDAGLLAALRGHTAPAPDAAQLLCALAAHLQLAYGARGGLLRNVALGRQGHALAIAAGDAVLPFALHWQDTLVRPQDLSALLAFCARTGVARAYVATRAAHDFGALAGTHAGAPAVMRVPAALLCLWLASAAPVAIQLA